MDVEKRDLIKGIIWRSVFLIIGILIIVLIILWFISPANEVGIYAALYNTTG